MKVVILAGGFGTRIAEANGPKPMVNIGNKPILYHIMNYYKKFGYNDQAFSKLCESHLNIASISVFEFLNSFTCSQASSFLGLDSEIL